MTALSRLGQRFPDIVYNRGLTKQIASNICDRISENGSKSHIFISLYLLLLHGHYYIFYIISYHYMEFNAQIIKTV